ncbi:MAG TPA: YiiD C-terminal domain-containing protein [Bacteroidales bacterium]|nr:YiiD C-terminal domain-containing protein [Bacteroidales bacterium]
MNVTEIPFNHYIGIKESNEPKYLLMLEKSDDQLNHLGTMHASAQFSLAEATSGYFLLKAFGELATRVIPVVRKSELKFRKPAMGNIYSTADFAGTTPDKVREELNNSGRALVTVEAKIFDDQNQTLTATFEWFIQKIETN